MINIGYFLAVGLTFMSFKTRDINGKTNSYKGDSF